MIIDGIEKTSLKVHYILIISTTRGWINSIKTSREALSGFCQKMSLQNKESRYSQLSFGLQLY